MRCVACFLLSSWLALPLGFAQTNKMGLAQANPLVSLVFAGDSTLDDAVALANNHSGDFGPEAFADMLQLLKKGGLPQVGGGMNLKEAHAPLIFERKGLRIAVLSYNEFQPRSFEAGHNLPGVAWSEDQQVVADILAARTVHKADLVIPIMHWGWENEGQPTPMAIGQADD